jgi:hypothetical protein
MKQIAIIWALEKKQFGQLRNSVTLKSLMQ